MQRSTAAIAALDLVEESVRSIAERPARSAATALAFLLGMVAAVSTLVLGDTATQQVSRRFNALRATEVIVRRNPIPIEHGPPSLVEGDRIFPAQGVAALRTLRGVEGASELLRFGRHNVDALPGLAKVSEWEVYGTDGEAGGALEVDVEGAGATAFRVPEGVRVAWIGAGMSRETGLRAGDALLIDGAPLTVAGVIGSSPRLPEVLDAIVLPSALAESLFGDPDPLSTLLVRVTPGAAAVIAAQAPVTISPTEPSLFRAAAPPDPRRFRAQIEGDTKAILLAFAGIGLLLGVMSMSSAAAVRVVEHRGDIALQRALGATRRAVVAQVVSEGGVLGMITGLVGAILAIVIVAVYSAQRDWLMVVDPRWPFAAPIAGALAGALASLRPAITAAGVEPAESLRGG